jgi:hypothetical protein
MIIVYLSDRDDRYIFRNKHFLEPLRCTKDILTYILTSSTYERINNQWSCFASLWVSLIKSTVKLSMKSTSIVLIGKTVIVPKMSSDRDWTQNLVIISQIQNQFLPKLVTLKYINPNNISLCYESFRFIIFWAWHDSDATPVTYHEGRDNASLTSSRFVTEEWGFFWLQ